MRKDFFYIYNFKQALFFIQNGLIPIDIDKAKNGDVFHKFIRNEETENIFMKWKKLKYGDAAI